MVTKSKQQDDADSELLATYVQGIFDIGLRTGYRAGYADGFTDGAQTERASSTAAVSDGLRSGSSECAKKMNDYKK